MLVPIQAAISRPKGPLAFLVTYLDNSPLEGVLQARAGPATWPRPVRSPGEPEARASGRRPTLQREGSFPVALRAPGGSPRARDPQQVQA